MANGANNEEVLKGIANVLKEASAALARIGVGPGSAAPIFGGNAGSAMADAAANFAQVAAAFATGSSGAPQLTDEHSIPEMTSEEFVSRYDLESWVVDMLELLTESQRATVVNPPLKVERARNLNGVVVSRIRAVVPVERRVAIFAQINDLGEGVIDRLSTLTPEQCEAVMESGFKLQRVDNPSGVAMRRITNALKSTPAVMHRGTPNQMLRLAAQPHAAIRQPPNFEFQRSLANSAWQQNSRSDASRDPLRLWSNSGSNRSRSPPRRRQQRAAAAPNMQSEIQTFIEDFGLEWWVGEVLKRLSLWQLQSVMRDVGEMRDVRNPAGIVMARVRATTEVNERASIFVDINQLDRATEDHLSTLTNAQKEQVMAPGIYVQNARDPCKAVRSRIDNVLAGSDAIRHPSENDHRDSRRSRRDDNRR